MPRIPSALLAVVLAGSLSPTPAFLIPGPSLIPGAAGPPRGAPRPPGAPGGSRTLCMSAPAPADGARHAGTAKLFFVLRSLRKPTKGESRTDPLNAVSCYLDRSAKIQSDVEELAMHLAAERAIQCSRASGGGAACDLASGGSLHGRWKLEYSTDPLLQAASGLSDIHQECDPQLSASDEGTVIRNSWGSVGGRQFALEGVLLEQPAPTKFPYAYKRSLACLAPWLQIPLPPAADGGYFGVLFSDGAVRVDWEGSGAINIYSAVSGAAQTEGVAPEWARRMPAAFLATGILAQVGGFLGADMRKDKLGEWLSDWKEKGQAAQDRALQTFEPVKVPGIKFDMLTESIKPWALAIALVLSSSTGANAATQLVAEDPVAAAALVEPAGLSNGVAFALVAPLLAYRLAALAKGEKLLPQLEFVILMSVCALVIRAAGGLS